MAPLAVTLAGVLTMVAGGLVSRVLISLGVGVASWIGMGIVLDYAFGHIVDSFNGLPGLLLHFAALLKIDIAVNMIMGAATARFGLFSMNGIVSRFQIDPTKFS